MTIANGTNHRVARKSLVDQIDRLDTILDGLAEALNESVADAVRGVIGQAVREAVQEVLSSPALLRAALEKHTPLPAAPEPKKSTLKKKLAGIFHWLSEKVAQAVGLARKKPKEVNSEVSEAATQAVQVVAAVPSITSAIARQAWAYRKPCAVAPGVGVACSAACYLGGQLFSSLANGLGGAAVTLSALTFPLRRHVADGNS